MEVDNKEALIQDTIRILPLGKKYSKAVAVILLAPPGAGKWELAERLQKELGFTHLEADKIRHFLAPEASFFDNLDHVTEFTLEVMIELTKHGYSSVLDRNVNKKGYREKFKVDIESAGGEMVEIVIDCPDDVALENAKHDNVDIQAGEREGHILSRDFWQYKASQVEPPIGENRYEIPCQYSEEDWQRLLNFLKLRLTSS